MPRVFVTGFFGVPNAGDEAVCVATSEGLQASMPDCALAIVTRDPTVTREFAGAVSRHLLPGFFPSLQYWMHAWRHVWAVCRADMVVVGGGGLLQDVHGWTTVATHLLPACLGSLVGRPVVTVGLGVGPIHRPWLRALVRDACGQMAHVMVRDETSRQTLLECGVREQSIEVTADVVLSLGPGAWPRRTHGIDRGPDDPRVVGFALREWPDLDVPGMAAVWRTLLQRGLRVRLLCCEPGPDARFYRSAVGLLDSDIAAGIEVHVPDTVGDAVAAVADLDALVAMRLHAAVFAAATRVPFVALPYDSKLSEFVRRAGHSGGSIALSPVDGELADTVLRLLAEPRRGRVGAVEYSALRDLAKRNFARAVNVLTGGDVRPRVRRLLMMRWLAVLLAVGVFSAVIQAVGFAGRRIPRFRTRAPGGRS